MFQFFIQTLVILGFICLRYPSPWLLPSQIFTNIPYKFAVYGRLSNDWKVYFPTTQDYWYFFLNIYKLYLHWRKCFIFPSILSDVFCMTFFPWLLLPLITNYQSSSLFVPLISYFQDSFYHLFGNMSLNDKFILLI